MGANSAISWTDHTFNPWIGCQKVSAACANCYAAVDSPARVSRAHGLELWGPAATAKRRVTGSGNWNQPKKWNGESARQHWRGGQRMRVFCASQADIFEDFTGDVVNDKGQPLYTEYDCSGAVKWSTYPLNGEPMKLDDARVRLFQLMEETASLDWLLLTKRPENILRMVPEHWRQAFPGNIWVGTTVEDQAAADLRIPQLLTVPASVRFLSCEPLLGPVDVFRPLIQSPVTIAGHPWGEYLHWVIAGGESGPSARISSIDWVRNLRDDCLRHDVPFHFKQWGEWVEFDQVNFPDQSKPRQELSDGDYFRVGRTAAGRLLDGREWNEFPKVVYVPVDAAD